MKMQWWPIKGPARTRYDSESDYALALQDADGHVREMLAAIFEVRPRCKRVPEPVAACKAPVRECERLRYAVPGSDGWICTRWPCRLEALPEGAGAVFHEDGTVSCDRFVIRHARPSRPSRTHRSKPATPRIRTSRSAIASWLMAEVAKAASLPGEAGRAARAYLAGDVPIEDAALIEHLRRQAAKTGRPRR